MVFHFALVAQLVVGKRLKIATGVGSNPSGGTPTTSIGDLVVKHHIQMDPEVNALLQELSTTVQGIGRCIGSKMGHSEEDMEYLIVGLGHAQEALSTLKRLQYS
jgi:hypothetical protein